MLASSEASFSCFPWLVYNTFSKSPLFVLLWNSSLTTSSLFSCFSLLHSIVAEKWARQSAINSYRCLFFCFACCCDNKNSRQTNRSVIFGEIEFMAEIHEATFLSFSLENVLEDLCRQGVKGTGKVFIITRDFFFRFVKTRSLLSFKSFN